MNEQWHWQLAQDRRQRLMDEARQDRLLREAGLRDRVPAELKLVGLALIILPLAVMLVRGLARA